MSTPSGASRPVSEHVLQAAIEWQLCMGSGEATEGDHGKLQTWLDEHADHRRAWAQLGALDAELLPARGPRVRSLLVQPPRDGLKKASGLLAVLAALGLVAFSVDAYQPLSGLLADHRTATGQQQTLVLPDKTLLHINTRSAVDVAFDARQRAIILREGEVFVETSHANPAEKRPFVVLTRDGSLRPLGTRFNVRTRKEGTELVVTEAAVAARPGHCEAAVDVPCAEEKVVIQGQSLDVRTDGLGRVQAALPEVDAWRDGMLVVENRPLAEVAAEIARYRPGRISVDPRIAHLRVTGTAPLADTDFALASLTAALPVKVEYRTAWWVRLVPAADTTSKK